jgi:hypothetical protein
LRGWTEEVLVFRIIFIFVGGGGAKKMFGHKRQARQKKCCRKDVGGGLMREDGGTKGMAGCGERNEKTKVEREGAGKGMHENKRKGENRKKIRFTWHCLHSALTMSEQKGPFITCR